MNPAIVREPLPTVAALLDPTYLGRIVGRPVSRVDHEPLTSVDALSEAPIERIVTSGPGGTRAYVLKRLAYASDWVMQATGDARARAIQVWTSGLLDQLPDCIEHATVACARDGAGWAVLMHDVGRALVPPGDAPITTEQQELFLGHMATMHATFWEQRGWDQPGLGFLSLRQRYLELAPATLRPEPIAGYAIPRVALLAWDRLEDAVAPDVAAAVRDVHDDPGPLCRALGRYPQAVIHGDWKLGNLGLTDDGSDRRTVLLDWAVVGVAPPAADLAWYLAVNAARLPVTREATLETFERCLRDALGDCFVRSWWEPQLDLALLGAFAQLAWPKVHGALFGDPPVRAREQDELRWWSERARRGAARID